MYICSASFTFCCIVICYLAFLSVTNCALLKGFFHYPIQGFKDRGFNFTMLISLLVLELSLCI